MLRRLLLVLLALPFFGGLTSCSRDPSGPAKAPESVRASTPESVALEVPRDQEISAIRSALPTEGEIVKCTLFQFGSTTPGSWRAPWWAGFHVTNGLKVPIVYSGGPRSPAYRLQFQRDGQWKDAPGGPSYYPYYAWQCGNGMRTCSLAPGESMDVAFYIPADDNTYRILFGEPPVVTEAMSPPPR
jgi:hypothetical protein